MTAILEDYFTVEFTNIEAHNMFFFREILNNLDIKIVKAKASSVICQHQDYNTLLWAVNQHINRKDTNEILNKLLINS